MYCLNKSIITVIVHSENASIHCCPQFKTQCKWLTAMHEYNAITAPKLTVWCTQGMNLHYHTQFQSVCTSCLLNKTRFHCVNRSHLVVANYFSQNTFRTIIKLWATMIYFWPIVYEFLIYMSQGICHPLPRSWLSGCWYKSSLQTIATGIISSHWVNPTRFKIVLRTQQSPVLHNKTDCMFWHAVHAIMH